MEFTGAEGLTATVHHAGQETGALEGTFDPATQVFTVDDADVPKTASLVEPYDALSWVVSITVPDGNVDDVNVHFETVSFMPPPAPPRARTARRTRWSASPTTRWRFARRRSRPRALRAGPRAAFPRTSSASSAWTRRPRRPTS